MPHATTPNDDPTVTLSFGSGYHNGSCDGPGPDNCPQLTWCAGKVNLHVVPKPFTSFTNHPGTWGVGMFGTFDFTQTLSNCGQTRDKVIDVWSSVGTKLGEVTLWIFCTWCSNSTGDA